MAPSRGLSILQHTIMAPLQSSGIMKVARRAFSSFSEKLSNPANSVQSYVSHSSDPYLNLAIEDHILRTSPAGSAVLFLYTNRPCVVIGRNQNPWREVNLGLLKAAAQGNSKPRGNSKPPAIGHVQLVRRRSGGGAVFHDMGNVNWSITCPRDDFTRDKHAEMVVRALRALGVDRARVNERHDIVLDQGYEKRASDPNDTHRTPYTVDDGTEPRPLKVSGSAYKLTRGRALHHATTLLASPNLHIIPQYLHSPAKPYLESKGVQSVSSPVGNIGLDTSSFQKRLQDEFAAMYAPGKSLSVEVLGEEHLNIPEIRKGYDELRTNEWILTQTPQFTLKLGPSQSAQQSMPSRMEVNVHHGIIKAFEYESKICPSAVTEKIRTLLVKQKLQDIQDWRSFFQSNLSGDHPGLSELIDYLEEYLPIPEAPTA
ncbi:uncharacterized protein EI97DRAFT_452804 [Westerdykella ornata]|uniref:Putative lipoate-protein ligase A n=1 Tax=Westerdykella ornata TaxID=318751 RepID=A0A6A6J8Y1_WESOR|nr:uncharacterized protein EI97DRAFT_452804 [Westerdykella ornata]KAF2272727.1 hypothetical protein EI97DRAFT_452804 [Westerdykella ornata]